MLEPTLLEFDDSSRWCLLDCEHGELDATDHGSGWSDAQLLDFCRRTLSARARCTCFGDRVWLAPARPEHLDLQVRLFADEPPDPTAETERPSAIPPWAVSLAAARSFDPNEPPSDDHDRDADLRLARWWKWNADLGLLPGQ